MKHISIWTNGQNKNYIWVINKDYLNRITKKQISELSTFSQNLNFLIMFWYLPTHPDLSILWHWDHIWYQKVSAKENNFNTCACESQKIIFGKNEKGKNYGTSVFLMSAEVGNWNLKVLCTVRNL